MTRIQKAARLLGGMGKGVKKTISEEDRQRRIARLVEARKKRWKKSG